MQNRIHPTAILEGEIELGASNVVGPYSVLVGPMRIGDDNHIGPHASIGAYPDVLSDRRSAREGGSIEIGNGCVIRDFVSVHKPYYRDATVIGDDVYVMSKVHVGHDALIEAHTVLAISVALGGIVEVLEGAFVALGAAVQQRCILGQYSIVGAAAAAVKCVRPFTRFIPGRSPTVNHYAIERYGFTAFAPEIEAYVASGERPQSSPIREFVQRYEAARDASGAGEH